jgi:hypothetical protein
MKKAAAPSMRVRMPIPHVVSPGTPAGEPTDVFSVTLLLPETESVGLTAATVAVLEIVPNEPGAVTIMSNAADAELSSDETVQVTVPLTCTQPASAETKTALEGSVSVMVTVVAESGP